MEKEFVPYDLALELKDLGFGEECFAWYNMSQDNLCFFGNDCCADMYAGEKSRPEAPLWQQAFRFFREKYNLRGFIGFRPNVKKFDYHIYDMSLSGKEYVEQRTMEEFNKDPKVGTYEEAELECLKKLIEIVKK